MYIHACISGREVSGCITRYHSFLCFIVCFLYKKWPLSLFCLTDTYERTYIHIYVRTYIYIYVHTYRHTYMRAYIHTYMYIQTNI